MAGEAHGFHDGGARAVHNGPVGISGAERFRRMKEDAQQERKAANGIKMVIPDTIDLGSGLYLAFGRARLVDGGLVHEGKVNRNSVRQANISMKMRAHKMGL